MLERGASAGYYVVELVENEEAAFRDLFADYDAPVRVEPGRVGLQSAAELHYPEILIRSFVEAPQSRPVGEELGVWPVVFRKGRVGVWSGNAYPGDQPPIKLVKSAGDRYVMRITVERKDVGGQDLDDYALECYERDGEAPRELERFTVDFWPAP